MMPIYQQLLDRNLLKLDVVGYAGVEVNETIAEAFPQSVRL